MSDELKCGDISGEQSRTYTICGIENNIIHVINIPHPEKVFYGLGHTFHRVFDGDIIILAPAPGFIWQGDRIVGFCEVSWVPRDFEKPVQF